MDLLWRSPASSVTVKVLHIVSCWRDENLQFLFRHDWKFERRQLFSIRITVTSYGLPPWKESPHWYDVFCNFYFKNKKLICVKVVMHTFMLIIITQGVPMFNCAVTLLDSHRNLFEKKLIKELYLVGIHLCRGNSFYNNRK